MAIVLDGTSGITNDSGYTGDGVSFADSTPANTLVTTSGGNVGIGTSSPGTTLHIASDGDTALTVQAITGSGQSPSIRLQRGTWGTDGFNDIRLYNASGALYADNIDSVGSATNLFTATTTGLGIGTSSPTSPLEIAKAASVDTTGSANKWTAKFRDTTAAAANVGGGLLFQGRKSAAGAVGNFGAIAGLKENATDNNENGYLAFSTTPNATGLLTERARIDSSGNLLVGTTAQISATTSRVNILNANEGLSGLTVGNVGGSGNTNCILFVNSNGIVGTIRTNGSSTSYNTSSDYRLKHDIQPMTGALAKVAQLKPVTYKWNADDSQSQGFIAHELQEVVPECVTGEKDAVDAEGNPQYQGIDTSFLVATLTAAIQELKGINDAQAQIITALTARVEALEGAQA
jgi:hypothetical protein